MLNPSRFLSLLIIIMLMCGTLLSELTVRKQNKNNKMIKKNELIRSDKIVVKFKRGIVSGEVINNTGIKSVDELLNNFETKQLTQVLPLNKTLRLTAEAIELQSVYYIELSNDKFSVNKFIQKLSQNENVEYAELLYYHELDVTPNDPHYSLQSGFFSKIQAPSAWDLVKGSDGDVVIAVVDGGTDYDHSDLSGNFWVNIGETPNNGIDDDNNGFVDDINGWNFANNSSDPTGLPQHPINANHGTHTGGSIAAVTNNTEGVAGASWNATLMPVNAGSPDTDNSIAFGYEGILYAVNNGADIISCSWGRQGGGSEYEQDVINYVTSLGAVVVAAAGNDNNTANHYPSSYTNVLSVAAVNNSDVKAGFSNFGITVDVSAPGVNIYSTYNNNSYNYSSGTSMACPLTAGIVGLVKTLHPAWSGFQAAEQVRVTADNIDASNPSYAGFLGQGRINAYRALTESPPSIRVFDVDFIDTNGDGIIDPGETIQINLSLKNFLAPAGLVNLTLSENDNFITLTNNSAQISSIDTMEEVIVTDFTFDVNSNAPSGHPIDFELNISSGTYQDKDRFRLIVLPTFATTNINNIAVSVTNIGRIGYADPDNSGNGIGFHYQNGANLLFEGALITGTSQSQLSNAARGLLSGQTLLYDEDFFVASGGDLQITTPGALTDQESIGIFEDVNNSNPMNIRILQETFASSDSKYDDFILFKYTVENLNTTALNNFHLGVFFDWDIDGNSYGSNETNYDSNRKLAYAYDTGTGPTTYVGISLITDGSPHFRAIANDGSNGGWQIYDGYSDAEKWESISGGVTLVTAGPADISHVIASGPHSIEANGSLEIGFALMAAPDLLSIQSAADSAKSFWNSLFVTGINSANLNLPAWFTLQQNTPNPFNPDTRIQFSLPKTSKITIEIFDILGKKIRTLTNQTWSAGNHQIQWDGTNSRGEMVAGNVYLYRLSANGFVQTRKMVLLK